MTQTFPITCMPGIESVGNNNAIHILVISLPYFWWIICQEVVKVLEKVLKEAPKKSSKGAQIGFRKSV